MLSQPRHRATSSYRPEYTTTRLNSSRMSKRVGQDFSYYPCDIIGSGMSSKVYKGTDLKSKKQVSVKVISKTVLKDNKLGVLVKNEIRLLTKVDHPNVLKLQSVVETDQDICIVTEFCGEGDLEARIKQQHKLSQSAAMAILKDVIAGYRHIAEKDIIHRDLKPANVFLSGGKAKIADFGFAITPKQKQFLFRDVEARKLNVGSPLYMPVETLEDANYSHKSDIFAIGVMFYEMLHGRTPWVARTEKELLGRMKKELMAIDPQLELSDTAKTFLKRSLAVTPEKRMGLAELLSFFGEKVEEQKSSKLKESCVTKDTSKDTESSLEKIRAAKVDRAGLDTPTTQYSSRNANRQRLNSCQDSSLPGQYELKSEINRYRKYPPINRKGTEYGQDSVRNRQPSRLYSDYRKNCTFQSLKPISSKNPKLVEQVVELLNDILNGLKSDTLKFLPNLLLSKLVYTISYYRRMLNGVTAPLKIPEDLIQDGQVSIISKYTDTVSLCNAYEPFLRRMIRLINHYSKQLKSNLDFLAKLLTFYRHLIEAGRYLDYWSRSELRKEDIRNLQEFKAAFSLLTN